MNEQATNSEQAKLVELIIGSVRAFVDQAIQKAEAKFDAALDAQRAVIETVRLELAGRMTIEQVVGPPGPPGKDAEPVDYAALSSTLATLVSALPKPQDGAPGKDGRDGKDADPEIVARMIDERVERAVDLAVKAMPIPANGVDGQDGQDGKNGERGEPGRDALELEIGDGIDGTRSYARGTWTRYDGGLWRAARSTTPFPDAEENDEPDITTLGWECMVRGIAEADASLDLERKQVSLMIRYSGAAHPAQFCFSLPMMIDRGHYQHGREYRAGDVVGLDGSSWIAQQDTDESPDLSKAWRLVAKKGRDLRPQERAASEPVRLR